MGKRIILVGFLCFLLSGCALAKKSTTSNTASTEKTEVKKDSSTNVKVNKAIDDQVSTQVAKTGDPVLDAKVDAILMSLNTQKSSGDNSYRFYYDAQLRELKAEFKVAQTKDSISNVKSDTKIEKTFEQQIEEYVKKIVIPWWMYLIGIIIAWRFLSPVLLPIYTSVKNFISSRILNPPK